MNDFERDTRLSIVQAVKDLFGNKDLYHMIDVDALSKAVLDFVLIDEDFRTVTETNRVEFHYRLLGQAVAVAQGWKLNYIEEVNVPSKTSASIKRYIKDIYNVKI